MSDIRTVQASDYGNALTLINLISVGIIELPIQVQCGQSTFTLSRPNFDALSLGVLMAASWPKAKDE